MSSSITVFLPTLGRQGLKATIRSFIEQSLLPDDRLMVLGSGWEEPWVHEIGHPQIKFEKCQLSTCKGHENIQARLGSVETDYWFYIGDDDVFMPGAFERARPYLDNEHIWVSQFMMWDGRRGHQWIHFGESEHHIQFCQVFFPSKMSLPDLTEYKDVAFMDHIWDDGKIKMMPEAVVLPKFHHCEGWVWPWEWRANES